MGGPDAREEQIGALICQSAIRAPDRQTQPTTQLKLSTAWPRSAEKHARSPKPSSVIERYA